MTDIRFNTILQAIVTIALLLFAAYMEPRAAGVSSVVVGAVIYHWLRQADAATRRVNSDSKPTE